MSDPDRRAFDSHQGNRQIWRGMMELYFIVGAFFGGILGFVIAALMNICGKCDEEEQDEQSLQ